MSLSIAFVVPYGEPSDGFFPDTLVAELCASVRKRGHRGRIVRVYYDGRDRARDLEVADRLRHWLAEQDADLVVLERLFDPAPVRAHVEASSKRRAVLITRGDSFDPIDGVDLVIGAHPGVTRTGATRRSPTTAELSSAFLRLVDAIENERDPLTVSGVSVVREGELLGGSPIEPADPERPYDAVVEQDVICLTEPPRVVRKTIFGNAGCPYAADPADNAHFSGVKLPMSPLPLARLGCAFCGMGGDYQKRRDDEVVPFLVEQAAFWTSKVPEIEELVLSDQYAIRYLAQLVRDAHSNGVRPVRWLFAARTDSFVHERKRVLDAIEAARATGHHIEVYLSGFEAFSDEELDRYNKGVSVAEQLAAIHTMRELAGEYPDAFSYSHARGHSLILWNPWTRPEHLEESIGNIRRHGTRDLFYELGRNRLRLYRDLPIFYAAKRDDVLTDRWEGSDEGAARRKGYNVEHPWRFLDSRTRLAYELARSLRERLGLETEAAQLAAIVTYVKTAEASADIRAHVEKVATELDALEAAFLHLATNRPDQGRRASNLRGAPVLFGGDCNNACATCANLEWWVDPKPSAVRSRIDAARETGLPIVLAGREPSMDRGFFDYLLRARGDDDRLVAVVTNGRRFADPMFADKALRSGLRSVSLKLFAPDTATTTTITGVPEAHEQALRGAIELVRRRLPSMELRVPLHRLTLGTLDRFAVLAHRMGVRQIRLECALDAVGIDALAPATAALGRLERACTELGVAITAVPLSAGTRYFDRIPGRAS